MERQYIGARYVPILGGAWDSNKSYEALTIVQANNSSYTSKKPVPPGVDISNTEYWVLTGNFNGQVEEYRQEVVAVSKNVESLTKEVENFTTKRRFIFIGDSYGRNVERDGVMIKAWPSRVVETLGLSASDAYMSAVSGAGFTVAGNNNKKFVDMLNDLKSTVQEPDTITDIVVIGGYNDRNNHGEIAGAIETFRAKSKELFPNATVTLGFVGRNTMRDRTIGEGLYRARLEYVNAIGCGYITNIEYCAPLSTMYTSDNVHPNNEGQLYIANAICKWILCGTYTCKFPITRMTLQGAEKSPTAAIDGNQIIFTMSGTKVTGNTFGSDYDFGKLETSLIYCSLFGTKFGEFPIIARDATEQVYVTGTGYLYVDENRHMKMQFSAQKAGGGTITTFDYVNILFDCAVLPCEFFL